ncbi:hypothetical protein PR202_ga31615 [Eleusine coracana subsp. coracana]|uniref:Uncharacterized protein n=1 Tax=Eleusine coracana subsp. coracana TaxID=191504 RepID=A0AAV5DRX3_ELECO|nr:hypothetical protein PR202_ga31615 [Eleusine coracana subsp. coracana]
MASTATAVASHPASSACRSALRDDEQGVPRSLRLLAALVEANAIRHADAASRPAESDLLRAFRGGAAARRAPTVSITEFLDRVNRFISLESVRHVIRLEGTSYVLAGIYLIRFMRSPAAQEAGIQVEPTTAHRLVAVALFLGAKFGGPDDTLPTRWTFVFEVSSDGAIRAHEIAELEERFLRAVNFRLFVDGEEFDWFCGILEQAPPAPSRSCSGSKRKAEVVEVEGEDERRCVRACLPSPAVVAN